MRSTRLILTLLLVAGIPIGLFLWGLLAEWRSLGLMSQRNPLEAVATDLMERVDQRMSGAQSLLVQLSTDPNLGGALSPAESAPLQTALDSYRMWVTEGVFLALAVVPAKGDPAALFSDEVDHRTAGRGPLALDWRRLPLVPPESHSAPVWQVSGRPVVALEATLDRGAVLVGLVDLQRLIGQEQVARMKLAQWGEAFLADGNGRIFVSAHPELLGQHLQDLGWTEAGSTRRWTDDGGEELWVVLAGAHPSHIGPQQVWQVGLTVPTRVVAGRSTEFQWHVVLIGLLVILITAGMIWVLRRSVTGRAPGHGAGTDDKRVVR